MNGALSIPDDKRAGSEHSHRPRLKPYLITGAVILVLFTAIAIPAIWKISRGALKDLGQADNAVSKFHQQLDAGSFEQIYADSDDALKQATTQQKFIDLLSAVPRKLGTVKSTEREGYFVNFGTSGERLRLTYATQFEDDNAQEQFTFQVIGDDCRLVGYQISSDALITK